MAVCSSTCFSWHKNSILYILHCRKDSKENYHGSAETRGDEEVFEVETNAKRFEPPKLSQENLIDTDRKHIKKEGKSATGKNLPQKKKEVNKCVVIQNIKNKQVV